MDEVFKELLAQIKGSSPPEAQPEGDLPPYDKFLATILSGDHPPFAELIWDGDNFTISFTVQFKRLPGESREKARKRIWAYFKRFGLAEQKISKFRLIVREGEAVHAQVEIRPEAVGLLRFGTGRLRELQNPQFLG